MSNLFCEKLTTSCECRLEPLLQFIQSSEVLLWKRVERSVIGVRVEEWYAQKGDYEIYRISLLPLWQVQAEHLKYPQRFDAGFSRGLVNKFQVIVDHRQQLVVFGPMGNIILNPEEIRGLGLGSYAFSLLIRWLQQRPAKTYAVQSGFLSGEDAKDEVSHRRRNQFYMNMGFHINNNADGWGTFTVNSVADLHEHINSKKITEAGPFPIANLALSIIRRLVSLRLLRWQVEQRDEEIERLQLERGRARGWNRKFGFGIAVLLILMYLIVLH